MPADFAPGLAPAAVTPLFGAARLDAEKLDCYRLAVEFQAVAVRLLPKRGSLCGLRDQPDRGAVVGEGPSGGRAEGGGGIGELSSIFP
jgi:hypothetical protein